MFQLLMQDQVDNMRKITSYRLIMPRHILAINFDTNVCVCAYLAQIAPMSASALIKQSYLIFEIETS